MERAATVLDYAVVVVSGPEGVQGHTETVWAMLRRMGIPAFVFVNKTDRPGFDRAETMAHLRQRLSGDCVDMWDCVGGPMPQALREAVAERDEALLERLLTDDYDEADWLSALRAQLRRRELFPVYFGSALNDEGVAPFLDALVRLTEGAAPDDAPFRARVYKLRHDPQGARLTFF